MRPALFLCLLLTGCGGLQVVPTATEGVYTLRYEMGAIESSVYRIARMSEEASDVCPDGWQKLSERRVNEGQFDITYVWHIRCL